MGASRLASARLPTHPPARPPRSSLREVGVANVQKGLGGLGASRGMGSAGCAKVRPRTGAGLGAQGSDSRCAVSGPVCARTLHAVGN